MSQQFNAVNLHMLENCCVWHHTHRSTCTVCKYTWFYNFFHNFPHFNLLSLTLSIPPTRTAAWFYGRHGTSCIFACAASRMHKVKLEMPADEAGDVLTVEHLAKQVCIETGVDLWNQVLTFKG